MRNALRTTVVIGLLACLGFSCVEPAGPEKGASDMSGDISSQVMLEKLVSRPAWISHMGCLIGCAEYLRIDASPAWIYGGSGHAFALNIHEAICPSGPTAWATESCDGLAANVGVKSDRLFGHKQEEDFAQTQQRAWDIVRRALDANLPCVGWDMGVPEWYVICGYDAEGNYLYRDYGGKLGKRHHTKLGETEIGAACILTVERGEPADDRTVVREALLFATEHGAGKHSHDKWHSGLAGYDAWIKALGDEKLAANDEVVGFGQSYNAHCWAECRRQAVAFLTEARARLNDGALTPNFDEAIEHYKTVSAKLNAVAEAFPFEPNDKPAMRTRYQEAPIRKMAAKALTAARAAERKGLSALARILKAL